jgi:hypothetical protein
LRFQRRHAPLQRLHVRQRRVRAAGAAEARGVVGERSRVADRGAAQPQCGSQHKQRGNRRDAALAAVLLLLPLLRRARVLLPLRRRRRQLPLRRWRRAQRGVWRSGRRELVQSVGRSAATGGLRAAAAAARASGLRACARCVRALVSVSKHKPAARGQGK